MAVVDANARAEGNRRAVAVAIGTALFAHVWPAQIVKVRVDGFGGHEIAGLVLSGVKFHGRVDVRRFADEVAALVGLSLAAAPVEEVDVWATTPLSVAKGTIVAGDNAQPTARVVFAATVRRSEASRLRGRLRRGEAVYWNRAWKQSLGTAAMRPGLTHLVGVAKTASIAVRGASRVLHRKQIV